MGALSLGYQTDDHCSPISVLALVLSSDIWVACGPQLQTLSTRTNTHSQMQQGYSWPEKAHCAGPLSVGIADITCVCVCVCERLSFCGHATYEPPQPVDHSHWARSNLPYVDLEIKMTIWIVLGKAGNFALWIILSVSHSVWLRWLRVNECIL